MKKFAVFIWIISFVMLSAYQEEVEIPANVYELPINLEGSLQNPAWSPDGIKIIFEVSNADPDKSNGTKLWVLDNLPDVE